jgi:hypothetical protein
MKPEKASEAIAFFEELLKEGIISGKEFEDKKNDILKLVEKTNRSPKLQRGSSFETLDNNTTTSEPTTNTTVTSPPIASSPQVQPEVRVWPHG